MQRVTFTKLYDWVRDYLPQVGAYRDNGRAISGAGKKQTEALSNILEDCSEDIRAHYQLSYILPVLSRNDGPSGSNSLLLTSDICFMDPGARYNYL